MKTKLIAVGLLACFAACKEAVKEEEFYTTEVTEMSAPMAEPVMADYKAYKAEPAADEPTGYSSQKIIRNADLRFETGDMAATTKSIQAAVKKYGAQMQHDTEGKDDYSVSRNLTVRIPGKSFDTFINDISKGVAYFDRKEISSQDVTEQYVDTEARVKAKKVLEARYLELIGKAKKVSEILEIEKELSAIREEIEAKEGHLRYMKSRIAMSTINIEFYKKTESGAGTTVSYGDKMGNAFKSGFNALSTLFLGLLQLWPFILIFVIAFIIIRKKLRRRKKQI